MWPRLNSTVSLDTLAVASLSTTLNLDTLTAGVHTIGLRMKDDRGRWSNVLSRPHYSHSQPVMPNGAYLAYAECFVEQDPGIGLATPIPLPLDGVWDESQEGVQARLASGSSGSHSVGMRFQDSFGRWSPTVFCQSTTGIRLLSGTELPEIHWQSGLSGALTHVYRSNGQGEPFVEIGVTADSFFVDSDGWAPEEMRLYRITVDVDP